MSGAKHPPIDRHHPHHPYGKMLSGQEADAKMVRLALRVGNRRDFWFAQESEWFPGTVAWVGPHYGPEYYKYCIQIMWHDGDSTWSYNLQFEKARVRERQCTHTRSPVSSASLGPSSAS